MTQEKDKLFYKNNLSCLDQQHEGREEINCSPLKKYILSQLFTQLTITITITNAPVN